MFVVVVMGCFARPFVCGFVMVAGAKIVVFSISAVEGVQGVFAQQAGMGLTMFKFMCVVFVF